MAVDVQAIKDSFPEFIPAGDPLIGVKLAEAQACVDYSVFSQSQGDQAVKYLTAHLLATSPSGKNARMVNKDGSTTYSKRWDELVLMAAAGGRVP